MPKKQIIPSIRFDGTPTCDRQTDRQTDRHGRRASVCRRRLRTVVASLTLRSPGRSWCPGQEQVGASLTEDGVSSGDRRAVGSRLQVLGPYAAKQQSRRTSLGQVQGTRE